MNQWTGEDELPALLESGPVTFYIGFDPSSDSLTVGNLLQLVLIRRFHAAGHRPIVVLGGATGMIGDPGGRSTERNLLSPDELARNKAAIRAQVERFVEPGASGALVVDNADWLEPFGLIGFLRDVGKHVTVNTMLARESVRSRLGSEHGISYTEFSYMLLQAYDFVHLNREHGCVLQCAGSDQYGNIVAGIDLARRMDGTKLYGLTTPLITRSDGQKLGKTADGAVWLDARKTSPYKLYQYFLNIADEDAGAFLRFFTELDRPTIERLESSIAQAPQAREAQKALAEEITRLVHGQDGLDRALRATQVLFGGELSGLEEQELLEIFADVPSTEVSRSRLGEITITEAVVEAGLAKSRSDARRRLEDGGIYLNNHRAEGDRPLSSEDLATETVAVLRSGKRSFALLRFPG